MTVRLGPLTDLAAVKDKTRVRGLGAIRLLAEDLQPCLLRRSARYPEYAWIISPLVRECGNA